MVCSPRLAGGDHKHPQIAGPGPPSFLPRIWPPCSLLAAASKPRQDENEDEADYPVEVTVAEFAPKQRLAETTDLELAFRNTGDETIPDLALTIYTGDENADGAFNVRSEQEGLADPNRPVWILENDYPKILEVGTTTKDLDSAPTAGAETSSTNTYTLRRARGGRHHPHGLPGHAGRPRHVHRPLRGRGGARRQGEGGDRHRRARSRANSSPRSRTSRRRPRWTNRDESSRRTERACPPEPVRRVTRPLPLGA